MDTVESGLGIPTTIMIGLISVGIPLGDYRLLNFDITDIAKILIISLGILLNGKMCTIHHIISRTVLIDISVSGTCSSTAATLIL